MKGESDDNIEGYYMQTKRASPITDKARFL